MKKLFLFAAFVFLCFSCFAFDGTVCIMPSNSELKKYLSVYFLKEEKISEMDITFDKDLLTTGDTRLYEYIQTLNKSDIYIIPIIEKVSDFTHLSLYTYVDGDLTKIYESLGKTDSVFNKDLLLKIYPLFTEKKYALLEFTDLVPGSAILIDNGTFSMKDNCVLLEEGMHNLKVSSLGYETVEKSIFLQADTENTIALALNSPKYNNLTIESFPEADVLIDGKAVGRTPFVLEEYTLPLILRLQAEGYSDRVVSLTEQKDKLSVNLFPVTMSKIEDFNKAQSKFYWSFTRTLLLFGGLAGTKASARFTNKAQKGINYAFYGAIGLSLVDMGFKLYKYFNGIKNISP